MFVDKDEIREDYAPVLDVEEGEVTAIINLGASAAIIKNVEENSNEIKFAVMSLAFEALRLLSMMLLKQPTSSYTLPRKARSRKKPIDRVY